MRLAKFPHLHFPNNALHLEVLAQYRRASSSVGTDQTRRRKDFVVSGLAMHHIYCSEKKEAIVQFTSSANPTLRGLYLFGKPGRVVIEGLEADVLTYEMKLKKMRWQKIMVMGRVYFPGDDASTSEDEAANSGEGSNLIVPSAAGYDYSWHFDDFREVSSEAELHRQLMDRGLKEMVDYLNRPFRTGSSMILEEGNLQRETPGGDDPLGDGKVQRRIQSFSAEDLDREWQLCQRDRRTPARGKPLRQYR
jgi:hypothetical protein